MPRLLLIPLLPILLAMGAAQPGLCDPELRSHRGDRLGYRERHMRCEGRYIAPQSGTTTLNLISYTLRPIDFDPASSGQVQIGWVNYPAESIALRISSLRSGVYYRLDTRLAGSERSFSWPTSVLHGLSLRGADLAFLAQTQPRAGAPAQVMLPVDLAGRPAGAPRSPRLVVVPGRRLEELYITVLSADGGRVETPRVAVGQRPYAPGRRVTILLPNGLRGGVYRVRLEAVHGSRTISSIEPSVFVP